MGPGEPRNTYCVTYPAEYSWCRDPGTSRRLARVTGPGELDSIGGSTPYLKSRGRCRAGSVLRARRFGTGHKAEARRNRDPSLSSFCARYWRKAGPVLRARSSGVPQAGVRRNGGPAIGARRRGRADRRSARPETTGHHSRASSNAAGSVRVRVGGVLGTTSLVQVEPQPGDWGPTDRLARSG